MAAPSYSTAILHVSESDIQVLTRNPTVAAARGRGCSHCSQEAKSEKQCGEGSNTQHALPGHDQRDLFLPEVFTTSQKHLSQILSFQQ